MTSKLIQTEALGYYLLHRELRILEELKTVVYVRTNSTTLTSLTHHMDDSLVYFRAVVHHLLRESERLMHIYLSRPISA
jgi:hypothetical protein